MTDLIVVPHAAHWQSLKRLVLDSVSSPITRRVYNLGLDEFFEWFGREPRPGFTKATVCAWRVALETRSLGAVSINVRITAVRKLAVEAADNGLLAPDLAAGITRVKGVASKGVRLGNWLSIRQAQTLLNAPDATTTKGLRDRAILAVLLGCGLRRSEVAALTISHVQQRDGRWCIVDLVGKHGRVRTIPMPTWVKVATNAWTTAAGVADGFVFRPVNRGGQAQGEVLSEKVVWQMLRPYAKAAGVPGIAPHDARRSCAKFCRAARAELEQIQPAAWPRVRPDHRALPRYEAGPGTRAERRDQAEGDGLTESSACRSLAPCAFLNAADLGGTCLLVRAVATGHTIITCHHGEEQEGKARSCREQSRCGSRLPVSGGDPQEQPTGEDRGRGPRPAGP